MQSPKTHRDTSSCGFICRDVPAKGRHNRPTMTGMLTSPSPLSLRAELRLMLSICCLLLATKQETPPSLTAFFAVLARGCESVAPSSQQWPRPTTPAKSLVPCGFSYFDLSLTRMKHASAPAASRPAIQYGCPSISAMRPATSNSNPAITQNPSLSFQRFNDNVNPAK